MHRGRVLDVVAMSLPDGRTPGPTALGLARAVAEEKEGDALAFVARVDGETPVGVIFAPRHARTPIRDLGTEAATRSGLVAGVATSESLTAPKYDDLIAVAMEGLSVARATESLTAVHTELYEFVTRMRDRRGRQFEVVDGDDDPALEGDHIPRPPDPAARGKRTEVDDPFAFIDTNDSEMTDERATALAEGIAPRVEVLARREAEQLFERDALREEIESLREESKGLKRGQKDERSILERRLDKLVAALDKAEEEIERLRIAQAEDPGVSSAFRSVQGLDTDDENSAAKASVLGHVFKKNRPAGKSAGGPLGTDLE